MVEAIRGIFSLFRSINELADYSGSSRVIVLFSSPLKRTEAV